ncbi:MAG: U6 snRNA-associated Sm-like protein LSm2 [Icmadophila ericetorum]|nr:U6 snRNA-associated Sm-like protein LSm2 [Icmadophila ericetorum]
MLFFSFFKTLVDHEVTVELKNDISIKGTLKSVDQYLNIKLDDIQVMEEIKYPHLVELITRGANGAQNTVVGQKYIHSRKRCAICPSPRRSGRHSSVGGCGKTRLDILKHPADLYASLTSTKLQKRLSKLPKLDEEHQQWE